MNEYITAYRKNKGINEEEGLLNRFTAFISISINRQKATYLNVQNGYAKKYLAVEEKSLMLLPSETDFVSQVINSKILEDALKKISDRERYVIISRVIENKDFEEIANTLGIKYKGASAIYYRAIAKMRTILEDEKNV